MSSVGVLHFAPCRANKNITWNFDLGGCTKLGKVIVKSCTPESPRKKISIKNQLSQNYNMNNGQMNRTLESWLPYPAEFIAPKVVFHV